MSRTVNIAIVFIVGLAVAYLYNDYLVTTRQNELLQQKIQEQRDTLIEQERQRQQAMLEEQQSKAATTATTNNNNKETEKEAAQRAIDEELRSRYELNFAKVIDLNSTNFNRAIAENENVLVMFYAPWCARSIALLKELRAARKLYNNEQQQPVLIAKVNGQAQAELRDRLKIKSYPLLQLYRKQRPVLTHNGPTQPHALAAFLSTNTLAAMETIETKQQFDQLLLRSPHTIIGMFANKETPEYAAFQKVAQKISGKVQLALVGNQQLIDVLAQQPFLKDHSDVKQGVLIAIPQEGVYQFNDMGKTSSASAKSLYKWMAETQPAVMELTGSSLHRMTKNKAKPSALLFVNYSSETPYNVEQHGLPFSPSVAALHKVASKYRQSIQLFFIDKLGGSDSTQSINGGLVIVDLKKEAHYLYSQENELTVDTLKSFLDGFTHGKLSPVVASQTLAIKPAIPNTLQVVYDTFDQQVLKSNKHSLVYFNQPWCGFCKTMGLYIEKAAEQLKDTSVQVVDYDCSENTVPEVVLPIIDGYPYITLFVSGNSVPIPYTGDRSDQSIITFVKSHVTP
ncbi:hypothetical protein SAMD00019534_065690 [Acytostelium subglobosum LB1]|uniref:hypothetical protein n=1 Tax=Acytostelium subglobosum LB1 TaxID=1410327 RepID=UPI000644FE1B|nr:hypothetical protein SAMD00019534_065690 [Acytostelium subglobosum LB1]GAM23394.1 hypothetical protein SAMD00019534_065690 [Acytostelium subglobosum LB1]|eukprot:XP_012753843.1 hypothetical protein SAMD00019534_065690 [Acytostelium subglobosum LB1]